MRKVVRRVFRSEEVVGVKDGTAPVGEKEWLDRNVYGSIGGGESGGGKSIPCFRLEGVDVKVRVCWWARRRRQGRQVYDASGVKDGIVYERRKVMVVDQLIVELAMSILSVEEQHEASTSIIKMIDDKIPSALWLGLKLH